MPELSHIDHIVLTVADIPRTVAFYEALGMTGETFDGADGVRRTALTFGAAKINLHRSGAEFEPKAAAPTPGSGDLCLITTTPLSAWRAHLAERGVAVLQGRVRRTGAAGPIESLYLRDPDGNLVEISVQL